MSALHPVFSFMIVREGGAVSVTAPEDASAEELVQAFRSFMLAAGYHPDTVKQYLDIE